MQQQNLNPVFFRIVGYQEGRKNSDFQITLERKVFNSKTGEYEEKGVPAGKRVDKVSREQVQEWKVLTFKQGSIMLDPKNHENEIKFLRTSDANRDFEDRDTDVTARFYEHDPFKERQDKLQLKLEKMEFTSYIASEAKENEILEFAKAEGINTEQSNDAKQNLDLIKAEIIDRFELEIERGSTPAKYKAYFTDPNRALKAVVNECIAKNVITFNSGLVTFGAGSSKDAAKIAEVPAAETNNWSVYFVDWLSKAKQATIKGQLIDELKKLAK